MTFPFEPYAVQTAYMKKVILALENSQNAGNLIANNFTDKLIILS